MRTFDPRINTIYCDMDGVVADFDAFVLKHMGRTFNHKVGPKADAEMWDFLQNVDHLYLKLDPTPYMHQLLDAIVACGAPWKMLTAIPRRKQIATAAEDKRLWSQEHIDPHVGFNVRVEIGPFSADKWKHALPGDVIIDDRDDNIADWEKAGGFGILHDGDVDKTIARLHEITLTPSSIPAEAQDAVKITRWFKHLRNHPHVHQDYDIGFCGDIDIDSYFLVNPNRENVHVNHGDFIADMPDGSFVVFSG